VALVAVWAAPLLLCEHRRRALGAPRRDQRSARAPVGTSASSPVTDHSANSAEISPPDSPVSTNSSA